MQDRRSVEEEHVVVVVVVVDQDNPSEDCLQAHNDVSCKYYSTPAWQSSGSHIKDLGNTNRLLLDEHLDYFCSSLLL